MLFAFSRANASPFGRGVTEGDGEGKDAAGGAEDGDNFALTKGLLIAVRRFFCPSLALSGAARQLSQRESLLEDTEAHQPQRSRDADDLRHAELEFLK